MLTIPTDSCIIQTVKENKQAHERGNKMKINNMPEYANEYKYIVATVWNSELWFYGAYETKEKALDVAWQLDAIFIEK